MDSDDVSDYAGCVGALLLFGAVVLGIIFLLESTKDNDFNRGVIAAALGTHVAELVEQPDGTTEWRVREVEE